MNLIEELKWRGLLQDIIPDTEKQLEKEMTLAYAGFDPTADSLHIGSLVPILLLMHLQRAGHKPFALLGGATGMVGDPSGKSEERNMLPVDTLRKNTEGIRKQLEKFLDFDNTKANHAVMVNNYDWFENITFLDFIRDVGKFITVNYMLAKDSVQKRLESGMSFTEFTYQLVQGYDFYYLYKEYGVKLQMGGSDQWGNIVTGTELIRKKMGGDVFAFTAPLLKKADGGKFGKTETGNIWLDASRSSPYRFYQFWLNTSDEDAKNYIKIFTFLSKEEIENLVATHDEAPHLRALQKKLAEEITCMVHNKEDYEFAVKASQLLFGDQTASLLTSLSEAQLLDIMDGVPTYTIAKSEFLDAMNLLNLIDKTDIFPSKGEARKMIQQGAVSVNKLKVSDPNEIMNEAHLLNQQYILLQKGKKNYYLLKVE
ncbi:MAG: tyrosine--tRNA ligase [Chitinophagaceae bacterium]